MALKMNNVYCGDGFPNLPNFKDLSGGSVGSAAVMAGQAIRISDISVSNVRYKRINANVDDLTIAVDEVTNKLKSLVKGVVNYSTDEVDTGKKWVDGKSVYQKVYPWTATAAGDITAGAVPANMGTVVSIRGIYTTASGGSAAINYYGGASDFISCYTTAENVMVHPNMGTGVYPMSGNVILEYTKTT